MLFRSLLDAIMKDDAITEVMINGPRNIFIEKRGRVFRLEKQFEDEKHLKEVIERLVGEAGREVNDANPICDTHHPNGSRVNVVLPPVALCGPTLTIRKFSKTPMTMEMLIHQHRSITQEIADKLSISKSRTSQIVNTVLNSMRTPENKYKLFYGNDAWKKRQLAQKAADYAIRTQQEHLTYEEAKQKMKEQTPLPVTTRIDGVLLPTNVINALLRIGIDDLNQLREYTYNDLRRIKGLGERGLKRLMPILQKHDILKHE